MTLPYNTTMLTDAANIAEWSLVINHWTDGLLFSVLLVAIFALMFGIMQMRNVHVANSMIAIGFMGGLISVVTWLIQWNNFRLINTALPVLMFTVCGVGVVMKILKGWWDT